MTLHQSVGATRRVQFREARPDEAEPLTELAIRSKRSWGYGEDFMKLVMPDMIVRPEYLDTEHGVIAEDDGVRLGYAIVRVDGDAAFLRDLFIEPDHQRKGIGKALFLDAVQFARERGARGLTLYGDPNAIGFYERFGMRQIGEEPSIIGGGRMLPIMALDLAPPLSGSNDTDIRVATLNDLEAVVRLHHLVLETSMPYLSVLHTVDEGLEFFSKVFQECAIVVAEDQSMILGYCAYRDGWLDHLCVHPAHQRKGIGSILLEHAMQAKDALRLWVFQKNAGAITFYEHFGFGLVRTTDGSGNEEREPDALYSWERAK